MKQNKKKLDLKKKKLRSKGKKYRVDHGLHACFIPGILGWAGNKLRFTRKKKIQILFYIDFSFSSFYFSLH